MSDCRLQLATHALDQLKTTLKIAESLSNGLVHVPYLGAIAGATIEIINVAQEVTKNKKDAVELAKSVAERTTSLVGALAGKSKTDIPLQVHEEIRKYTDKLEVVRKTLCRHTGTKCWRRVLDRVSNRDEITDCKDMLNESFQVLQVALSINLFNLYANLPKVISQIKSCFEAHKLAQSKLTVIRREELDLREPWKSNGNTVTSVVLAEYNARAVVIKRYGADRTRWFPETGRVATALPSVDRPV